MKKTKILFEIKTHVILRYLTALLS